MSGMIYLTIEEAQALIKAKEVLSRFKTMTTWDADNAKRAHDALIVTLERVALKV